MQGQAAAPFIPRRGLARFVPARRSSTGEPMSCRTIGALAILLWLASCGGTGAGRERRLTSILEPSFGQRPLRTLAALPLASDVAEDEDPDQIAAGMVEAKFYPALNAATQYTLLPPSEVKRILLEAGLTQNLAHFYKKWISDHDDVDEAFLRDLAARLHADAIVGGAVDLWHQDLIDIMDTGAARTHVGLMLGLFDGVTGKRLWLGADSQFKDGQRYSGPTEENIAELQRQVERTNKRTVGGVYAPPDFSEVVDIVVSVLVAHFPQTRN
jgi:hypothetical protein